MKIRPFVFREARRFREYADDCTAHRLPHHLHASRDRSDRRSRRYQHLPGLERIALANVIADALHRAEDFIREPAAACLTQSASEVTRRADSE